MLLSVLFVLHITPLSIIDRKPRKLKLRMRENRIGHRFLHFLIMTLYVAKNKGADQLRGYREAEADLRLCFRICKSRFSHNGAQNNV